MNRILVTGSESFIGQKLIPLLINKKYFVLGIDKVKLSRSTNLSLDINSPKINNILKKKKIDTIIHLAAISRDIDCKKDVYNTFKSNVLGTLNLIKYSNVNNISNFIFASTEWVYDSFEKNKSKNENEPINIQKIDSEYALSKLVSENNLRQWHLLKNKINVKILRFGIIYGNRKNNWSAVESLFSQIKKQKTIEIGSCNTARRFIHVDDICRGIIASIKVKGFHIFNLQGGKIISLGEIIRISSKILNIKVKIHELNKNSPSIRKISNNKSKKLLKWKPQINIYEGLKKFGEFLNNE